MRTHPNMNKGKYLMRIFAFLLILFVTGFSVQHHASARSESIVAVVNEDAISFSDLDDRLKLVAASSGLPQTPEIYERLSQQVLRSLIDEQIMMQEARRLEIDISQEEIERGFALIARQNQHEPDEFRRLLQKSGISITTMNKQIEAQIAWSRIIQIKVRPRVFVSDSDINNVLERLNNNIGNTEYNVAEIFLPVDDSENEADARQLANKLKQQIDSGQAPFSKLAQQFSKAAGSSKGGLIGWVQGDQLPEELANALKTMEKGQLSSPIRSLTGYHILLVRDKRQLSSETIPSPDEIAENIGTERIDRMQRRYLLDLRSSAFIETRV